MSQEINQLSVLKVLKSVSKPYIFIDDVQPYMDIHSKEFTSVFEQLVGDELISSTQSPTCGLKMSGDGLPAWSGVNISITSKGNLVLNPVLIPKTPWYKNSTLMVPVAFAFIFLVITGISTYLYDQYKVQGSNNPVHKVVSPPEREGLLEKDP